MNAFKIAVRSLGILTCGVVLLATSALAQIQSPILFTPNTTARAGDVNANFGLIWNKIQGDLNGNVALGAGALQSNATGNANVVVGRQALNHNTTGFMNVAIGGNAARSATIANYNTVVGVDALLLATEGYGNTVVGCQAMQALTTGFGNVAIGDAAGGNVTGNLNIIIKNPGVTGESGAIRIGQYPYHSKAFIAGVYGSTAGGTTLPVVVDANGQLGTVSSSRRFKEDIRDMGSASDDLRRLRPVTFKYKTAQEDGSRPVHYGLIAEEVAKVYPDLVAYDRHARTPEAVLYQELPVMLLNELQKQSVEVRKQRALVEELRREVAELRSSLRKRVPNE